MTKKVISIIYCLIIYFSNALAQGIFIPPQNISTDSATYSKYVSLLKYSFLQDSIDPNDANKHNIFIAYHYLGAPVDTILEYVYKSIAYDPIMECENSCKKTSFTYPIMIEKYPKQWAKVCAYCDSIFSKFDQKLMDTLKVVSENDQKYRKKINLADAGPSSEAWKKQDQLDKDNLAIIESIFFKYGYPSKRLVGSELSDVAFLVVQHASLEKQEQYLPLIEKAVETRDLDKANLPYLIDRIRMGKKIPQLYGTQLIWNTGRFTL